MARPIYIKGMEELMAAFRAAGPDAGRFAAKALAEEAQEAFLMSQAVVPVEFGVLKSSGHVSEPYMPRQNVVAVDITYGGNARKYAFWVHELPPSRAKHKHPTRWKYLENPVKVYAQGMAGRMSVRVYDMIAKRFTI